MWANYGHQPQDAPNHDDSLVDYSMDERYLETIPEVDSLKSKRSSVSTHLTDSQFRNMAQPSQRWQRPQHLEPSCALSSHPTSAQWQPRDENRKSTYSDISPPSTPRKSWGGSIDETPVSPIEPVPPVPQLPARAPLPDQQSKSQIPKKIVSEVKRVPVRANATKEPTKWDVYSGERTTGDNGVISSVRPGALTLEEQYPGLKPRTKQILADLRSRDQLKRPVRASTMTSTDLLENPVHKEPWKGASGRTAILDPLQNTPGARARMLDQGQPALQINTSVAGSSAKFHAASASAPLRSKPSEEDIKPVVPLKLTKGRTPSPPHVVIPQQRSATFPPNEYAAANLSPSPSPPASAEPKMLQSPFRSPQPPKSFDEQLPVSSTRTDSPQQDPSPQTPRTPSPEPFPEMPAIAQQMAPPMEPEVSRFSWTTYETSITESPHSGAGLIRSESPPPPMPEMPQIHKRPVPTPATFNEHLYMDADAARSQGSIVIQRKPVPMPSFVIIVPPPEKDKDQKPELTTSKTLPQIPPELEAADKISGLEAQIGAASRRKYNLNRIIQNMRQDLEKNLKYDMSKRREVEKKINNYETELQASTNEEHELGLLLHRAVKKRDREDGYELPTGLWVRRVTS